ncbi:DUF4359 domain-containing protein [Apibacter adventoris]|uniref:DUF4359 domain-containing protein n=1 Tax=Apibacter adventoris TaxID=1679466 RepID=UPI000CF65BF6|nr:DUF4359 domain-containing protein [Apibacter adventoris]PQL94941.1 hypothetical protein C4S76_03410 [Apibacter adventoris]
MKLRYIFLFIFAILSGILILTNPDKKAHEIFLRNKFIYLFDQKAENELNKIQNPNLKFIGNLSKNILPALEYKWANNFIEKYTKRKNYLLFSTIQVLYKDKWHTVGIGILNHIHLFPSLEEKIQKLDVKSEALKFLTE